MRNAALRISAVGVLLVGLASPVVAQSGSTAVNSLANLSCAGANLGAGDGVAPVAIALTAGVGRVLQLNSVTGVWGCQPSPLFSADGFNSVGGICVGAANVSGAGKISGLNTPGRSMTVSALFLGAALPAVARANYNYGGAGAFNQVSYGGIVNDQIFFVGDGRTGDLNAGGAASGGLQSFIVPDDASFLYFGVADACGFVGSPSCYNDNSGTMSVEYSV